MSKRIGIYNWVMYCDYGFDFNQRCDVQQQQIKNEDKNRTQHIFGDCYKYFSYELAMRICE